MESWLPWLTADEHLLSDLLPASALVAIVEPRRLRDRAQELLDEEAALANTLAATWGVGDPDAAPRLSLSFERLLAHTKAGTVLLLAAPDNPDTPVLAASAFDPVVGDVDGLAARINGLRKDGFRVLVAAEGTRLEDAHRTDPHRGRRARRRGRRAARPRRGAARRAPRARSPKPISPGAGACTARRVAPARDRTTTRVSPPGDFVVHRVHGIGRYLGMETREMFDITRDRLVVEFKGGDRVYVDSEDIGLIRKYTGGEEPKLSKMGGADWEKTRARVRKAVRDIAAELVVLYRKRLATPGHAFAPDSPFQQQIEDAFPYEETPDQLKAIEETKADMERSIPMDRLICGDVGYGKTEVALRAAFKAVFDGKQVAVLVPTTLLASQHGQTFRERFANYPVRVEVLSRFLSAKEQNEVVKGVEDGRSTS